MEFYLPPTPPYSAEAEAQNFVYGHLPIIQYEGGYNMPQVPIFLQPADDEFDWSPPVFPTHQLAFDYSFPLTPISPALPPHSPHPSSDSNSTYDSDPVGYFGPSFTSSIYGNYPLPSTPSDTCSCASQEQPQNQRRTSELGATKAHTSNPNQSSFLQTTSSRGRTRNSTKTASNKGLKPIRMKTKFNFDPDAIFPTNDDHVFVLHTQSRRAPEVTDKSVTRLTPVDPPPSSPLARSLYDNEPYTRESYEEDCARRFSYQFSSPNDNIFTVSYSSTGTTIVPHDPPSPHAVPNAVLVFVHFPPGTFVVSEFPIGSKGFWRVQSCDASPHKHRGMPFPDGSWTTRYDAEDEETRRPARVVQHFSSCRFKTSEGDYFPLGKLARAIRSTLPGTDP